MTLTEIKDNLVKQLNKLTIDDFYANSNFVKDAFSKLTNLKTDEEIEKYLTEEFPKTTVESLHFSLDKSINDLNEQTLSIEKEIQVSKEEIEKLEKKILDKKEKQSDIPKQVKKAKSELEEIEKEIRHIKPLAIRPPYDKQIVKLEKDKEKKNKEINVYPETNDKLKSEIDELQGKTNAIKAVIKQKETEIKTIQSTISKKQKELEQLTEKENTYFKSEYSSLEFLFKILLSTSISARKIIERRKTGKKFSLDRSGERNYEVHIYGRETYDETIEVETGEVELAQSEYSFNEAYKLIESCTNSTSIIPKGWRKILYQTLSQPLPSLSGIIKNPDSFNKFYIEQKEIELSSYDTSALLALKIAAQTNQSIRLANNNIVLDLSGGLSAIITFREKGAIISKYQKQPIGIYANCFRNEQQLAFQTLYYQFGYADSTIRVLTPGAYYILNDKFVIEIDFAPAPILFDSNSIMKLLPETSSKAKREDEIEEERRQEEERRRQYDDDDDWD